MDTGGEFHRLISQCFTRREGEARPGSASLLNISPGEDRCFFLRYYRNPCNAIWSFSTVNGGGRLIANLLAVVLLRTLTLNGGPFAPPALPGFLARMGLS